MALGCGVYGFQITRPIELQGLRIEPRTTDCQQAALWAKDLDSYQLTGVIVADSISDERLFNLEAILSFIEHLDVLITSPVELVGNDHSSQFLPTITTHRRNAGGGAVLADDALFPTARGEFVSKTLERLEDTSFCERTQFKALFFKRVETFRQRKPFVEVTYFLLYSGLETYARSVMCERTSGSASEPICKLLTAYGFDVQIERPNDLKRAVSTYTHLRNALFHNSQFAATPNVNGVTVELRLFDYLFNFSQLVSLVVLKAVGFDDGHINWNSWIDMQPFR